MREKTPRFEDKKEEFPSSYRRPELSTPPFILRRDTFVHKALRYDGRY
ncbi:MAG: hypothetical protein KAU46_01895 [Candidatus Aminicenantes bacterium]|nr:hypothetical protein [Candidatus Aminicenantes bacterium]